VTAVKVGRDVVSMSMTAALRRHEIAKKSPKMKRPLADWTWRLMWMTKRTFSDAESEQGPATVTARRWARSGPVTSATKRKQLIPESHFVLAGCSRLGRFVRCWHSDCCSSVGVGGCWLNLQKTRSLLHPAERKEGWGRRESASR
jgi:hypothetical protein